MYGRFQQKSKPKEPLVSVITAVFNGAGYLEQTIESVLAQTYENIEYIIIDGGSTDGTLDIIRKYDRALAYWQSEPDASFYDAMNKGFAKTTGEITGWINADDKYTLWAFSVVSDLFRRFPQVGRPRRILG